MRMAFVGMMEGMQIALFAVVNLPEEERSRHPIAHKNCQLTFTGTNLQAFLIGRQICVTMCMFVVARITSVAVDTDVEDGSQNIFGVSDGLQGERRHSEAGGGHHAARLSGIPAHTGAVAPSGT